MRLFPEIRTEGDKFDFEWLNLTLGEAVARQEQHGALRGAERAVGRPRRATAAESVTMRPPSGAEHPSGPRVARNGPRALVPIMPTSEVYG